MTKKKPKKRRLTLLTQKDRTHMNRVDVDASLDAMFGSQGRPAKPKFVRL